MNEWKKIDKTIEVPLLGITVPNKDYAIGEIYISLIEVYRFLPQFFYVDIEKYLKEKFINPQIIYKDETEQLLFIGNNTGHINSPIYKSVNCSDYMNDFINGDFIIVHYKDNDYLNLSSEQIKKINRVFGINRIEDIKRTFKFY